MKQIEITFKTDGTYAITAKGHGKTCKLATKPYTDALGGKITSDVDTAEIHQTTQTKLKQTV